MSAAAHFSGIRSTLQNELSQATSSIRVAVAWFTDQELYKTLLEKIAAGVDVVVIIRNDIINLGSEGIDWQELIDANGMLYMSHERPPLHHKFCLIDGKKIISGSYNWTYAAQRNHENIIISSQVELVKTFRAAFDNLLDSADEVSNIIQTAIKNPPIATPALKYEVLVEVEYRTNDETLDSIEQNYEQLVLKGNAAYFQKRYEEAESYVKDALAVKQEGIEAHQILAEIYWRTEQFQKSINILKKAESYGLESAEIWNAFGIAYDGLNKYKEAIDYYDRSIKLAPHISTPYRNKFIAQYGNRQDKAASTTALEGGHIAAEAIKKNKSGGDKVVLLRAYMDRAYMHSDLPEARKYAQEALAVFKKLSVEDQDMHDLDEINSILTEKLRF